MMRVAVGVLAAVVGVSAPAAASPFAGAPGDACAAWGRVGQSLSVGTTLGSMTDSSSGRRDVLSVVEINQVTGPFVTRGTLPNGEGTWGGYDPLAWLYRDQHGNLWVQRVRDVTWTPAIVTTLNQYLGTALTVDAPLEPRVVPTPPRAAAPAGLVVWKCWVDGMALVPGARDLTSPPLRNPRR